MRRVAVLGMLGLAVFLGLAPLVEAACPGREASLGLVHRVRERVRS
jgi:hypothetical protein